MFGCNACRVTAFLLKHHHPTADIEKQICTWQRCETKRSWTFFDPREIHRSPVLVVVPVRSGLCSVPPNIRNGRIDADTFQPLAKYQQKYMAKNRNRAETEVFQKGAYTFSNTH